MARLLVEADEAERDVVKKINISPHTPIPVLRQYLRHSYWLQAITCLPVPLLLATIGPAIASMGTAAKLFWIVVLALLGGTSYALFDAAAKLRVSLRELIEIKLKMEKGQ